jgi:hypothetical protein
MQAQLCQDDGVGGGGAKRVNAKAARCSASRSPATELAWKVGGER